MQTCYNLKYKFIEFPYFFPDKFGLYYKLVYICIVITGKDSDFTRPEG